MNPLSVMNYLYDRATMFVITPREYHDLIDALLIVAKNNELMNEPLTGYSRFSEMS